MTHPISVPASLAGVALDVDGTMLNTESLWDEVEAATVKAHGGIPRPALIASFRGKSLRQTAQAIQKMLPHRHKPSADAVFDELTSRFRWAVTSGRVQVQPGVPELLEQLRTRAIPLAAVSNSPRRLVELTLSRTGLDDFFELIVCAGDDSTLDAKPAPDLYTFAAVGLGIDPRLSWGVEDSQPGVLALQSAHFLPLAVQPDAVPPTGPVLVTRSLLGIDVDWLFAVAAARALPHP